VQFVQHRRIETFMEETLLHLEKDEAINNLMLGIALRLQQDASLCPDAVCFTIRDEDGLALAALMTPPEKLIVYSPREVSAEPLRCLIQGVLDNNVSISGVIGPAKLARLFADLWAHQTGSPVKLEMHMRVYELREVNREVIGEGRLRTAEEKDLEFVIEAVAQFQRDAGFGEPDPETCAAMAKRMIANQALYLWELHDEIASMAAAGRKTRSGIAVNLVYTPKELRRRGYATSCVAALSQHLLDSGYKFCTLFADLANPISNSIYQKIGYRPIGDYDSYLF